MRKAPMSLQDLRRRIYVKAKAEQSWRFWGLYMHVCKTETLREAYRLAKKNKGAPGIDGVTFEAVEAQGVARFVEQLRKELLERTYRPLRVCGATWREPACVRASAGSGGVVDRCTTHSVCSTTTGSDTSGHRRKPLRPISHITLGKKCVGARSAGNPHAACEEAGAGDGVTDILTRARRRKLRTQPRRALRATAPALDPTRLKGCAARPE